MFQNQKYAFLNALILAIFIFVLGIAIGYWIENSRLAKIETLYSQTELNLLDIQSLPNLPSLNNSCELAIQENINFGDKIYEEAKLLKEYEDAERISDEIKNQHYKSDLLRVFFWINSVKIKNQCKASYHNILYFYEYENPSIETRAKQSVFSNILAEVKAKEGDNVMLIPIAGDINFSSIKLLRENYNIGVLPTIMIDEKIKITELSSAEEIESLLK